MFILPFAIIDGGGPDFTPYELARKRKPDAKGIEADVQRVEDEALAAVNNLIRSGVLPGSEIPRPDADRK